MANSFYCLHISQLCGTQATAGMKTLSSVFENKGKTQQIFYIFLDNSLRDKLDSIYTEPVLFQYKRTMI